MFYTLSIILAFFTLSVQKDMRATRINMIGILFSNRPRCLSRRNRAAFKNVPQHQNKDRHNGKNILYAQVGNENQTLTQYANGDALIVSMTAVF